MAVKKLIFIGLFLLTACVLSSPAQQTTDNQITNSEDFTLNISEKKISEEDYRANVKVSAQTPTRPVISLNIGVGVQAKKISVTLKNVTGDVKFRGSLEKLLEKLKLSDENQTSDSSDN